MIHVYLYSSGVYICKSVVNDLRHGNFICKSEANYLYNNFSITGRGEKRKKRETTYVPSERIGSDSSRSMSSSLAVFPLGGLGALLSREKKRIDVSSREGSNS